MLAASQAKTLREAAEEQGVTLQGITLEDGKRYSSSCLTTLWMTPRIDTALSNDLREAVQLLRPLIGIHLVDECVQGNKLYP